VRPLALLLLLTALSVGCLGPSGPASGEPPAPSGDVGPPVEAPTPAAGHQGTTYYVSPGGDDGNDGTAPDQPWQTIDKVNGQTFGPGDQVLFEGGQRFEGQLQVFPERVSTSPQDPLVIGSYGQARATIESADGPGIEVHNLGGVQIVNLAVQGRVTRCEGSGFDGAHGVFFLSDQGFRLSGLRVADVEVSGYCVGVALAVNPPGRYEDVRIERIDAHDNLAGGVVMLGGEGDRYHLANVYVGHSQLRNSPGVPYREAGANISGSGVFLFRVEGAMVEHNVAHDNGGANECVDDGLGGGPFAIWVYGKGVTLQHNEAFRQRVHTACPWDGGAFNVNGSNAVVQYNYSHDNDGSSILIDNDPENQDAVVRYNVSENDGRQANNNGAVVLTGGRGGYHVYNNTVFLSQAAGARGPLVVVGGENDHGPSEPSGVYLRNNALYSDADGPYLVADTGAVKDLRFEGNAYFDPSGRYAIAWGADEIAGIEAWSDQTGQERIDEKPTWRVDDPLLCDPGRAGVLHPRALTMLRAYRPKGGSPLVDAGLDLRARFNVDPGGRDLVGTNVPQGSAVDIGALEHPGSTDSCT
jgi:hypothetical protein